MTEKEFLEYAASVEPAYMQAVKEAEARQAKLAKPPHSLGKLEEISIKTAGITGRVLNRIDKCRVLVFAADNGVVCEGVAVTPQSVPLKQCINMTMHKTGMSALAKYFGNSVRIYDVGINAAFAHPGIIDRKVRFGTGNIRRGPAMSREECIKAICAGIEAAETAAADGVDAVGIGEMGIGNTTSSAAVLASLLEIEPDLVTERGSGLTDEAYELKKTVVSEAIKLNSPNIEDAIDVLSKVGGLDIAARAGAYIGLAKMRIPAVADGFISIVA
ncbi:MAG: nicotinate-nucleotide--dimethylbenzimidazole phosphoribosyltransferase, partial [Clostridia bacterium]|nr:nicotinate-nucleotide--dimethylbenzimidazole phosphoribosyltransferase [Clostridia bacterium]